MKTLIPVFLLIAIVAVGCSANPENDTAAAVSDIDGVWEMTGLYTFDDNGDSTKVDRAGHRQVKIYADGYVMWSRTVPVDSTQWYGWGGYGVENGVLKEWIEYGSHAFMPWIDPLDPFEHIISVSDNTYIQTRVDSAGNPQASEHYVLISEELEMEVDEEEMQRESLEGVWEMTKLEYNNMEVDRTGYRQIKMYHKGFVMWSQQVPADSVEWFGFGKYSSDGGILTEWMEFGSHSFMPFIGDEPFIQNLLYDEGTYRQILLDDEGNEDVTEHYRDISVKKDEGTSVVPEQ